jgi:hypothetical protein
MGNCSPGESLESCLKRSSETTDGLPEGCRSGQPVEVEIACNYQVPRFIPATLQILTEFIIPPRPPPPCQFRRFPSFNVEHLKTCHPSLDNATYYYLVRVRHPLTRSDCRSLFLTTIVFVPLHKVDTPDLDSTASDLGLSQVSQFASLLENVLNPTCTSNAMSLMCQTTFKACKAVEDAATGTQRWLPSLLCRSECDKHLEVWDKCLGDLEKEPDAKRAFDTQMLAVVSNAVLRSYLSCSLFSTTCFLPPPSPTSIFLTFCTSVP